MALFRRSIETADDAAADYFLRCVSEQRMISAWVFRSRQWRISPLGRLFGLCLPIRILDLALAGAWAFAGVLAFTGASALAGAWALSGVAAGVAGVATGVAGVAADWDRAAARSAGVAAGSAGAATVPGSAAPSFSTPCAIATPTAHRNGSVMIHVFIGIPPP